MAAPKINWFAGHMARAMTDIKKRLKPVDLVLEVRDARLPFSSANALLQEALGHKRRLVVLNKADLADPLTLKANASALQAELGVGAMITAVQQPRRVRALLQAALKLLQAECAAADTLLMMVVGVPNTGKSSLVNSLRRIAALKNDDRRGGTATVGPHPGVTRHLSAFQVGSQPSTFVIDTPGIMPPSVSDHEAGLKLALTGAIRAGIVPPEQLVSYLVHSLVQHKQLHGSFPATSHAQRRRSQQAKGTSPVQKSARAAKAGSAAAAAVHSAADAVLRQWRSRPGGPETPAAEPGLGRQQLQHQAGHAAGRTGALSRCSNGQSQPVSTFPSSHGNSTQISSQANSSPTACEPYGNLVAGCWEEGSATYAVAVDTVLAGLGLDRWVSDGSQIEAGLDRVLTAFRAGQLGRLTLD